MTIQYAEVDPYISAFATEFQYAWADLARKHDQVMFADQICMIGVIIGLVLLDVPPEAREAYEQMLLENIKDAKDCVEFAVMH